jgi:hypothetical protein
MEWGGGCNARQLLWQVARDEWRAASPPDDDVGWDGMPRERQVHWLLACTRPRACIALGSFLCAAFAAKRRLGHGVWIRRQQLA